MARLYGAISDKEWNKVRFIAGRPDVYVEYLAITGASFKYSSNSLLQGITLPPFFRVWLDYESYGVKVSRRETATCQVASVKQHSRYTRRGVAFYSGADGRLARHPHNQ